MPLNGAGVEVALTAEGGGTVDEAYGYIAGLITSPANPVCAGVDGEHTPAGQQHAPEVRPLGSDADPLGDGSNAQHVAKLSWDEPVKLVDVKARFEARTAARLAGVTQQEYWSCFRRFVEFSKLATMTRRQLGGRKGTDLLIAFAKSVEGPSLHTVMTGVRRVWCKGLELRWPLERDDLPRSSPVKVHPAPRRADVEPWAWAARNERDPYLRSWFMVELNHGLRPWNQQAALRRKHIAFSEATGKPLGFVADGSQAGFKTDSFVISALVPEEADALAGWLGVHPDASPEAYIWPWRSAKGLVDPARRHTQKSIDTLRRAHARRWSLPWLPSKAMRRFVKATLINVRMPDPHRSYWQGHKPKPTDMDFVYGTQTWEETFAVQLRYVPSGPMGLFASVRTDEGDVVPAELVQLWRKLKAKDIDAQDFAQAAKELVRSTSETLVKP